MKKEFSLQQDRNLDPQSIPILSGLIALVATCNRSTLLRDRSLPSIAEQQIRPDLILVVDDSNLDQCRKTQEIVSEFSRLNEDLSVIYLKNKLTPGASGAWNTGLNFLHENYAQYNPVIAILDDDDAWHSDHLTKLKETIQKHPDSEVFATGYLRHEGVDKQDEGVTPPNQLRIEDFLVGNPGIQGSNLAARLQSIIDIGGFDENLRSVTDRDLILRMIFAEKCYSPVSFTTVKHYAEPLRKDRLSTPASKAKSRGLDVFYQKWRPRMSREIEQQFLDRADRLFQWQPKDTDQESAWFVFGITSDASAPNRVKPLLEDLRRLNQCTAVSGIDVVLLENGDPPELETPSLEDLAKEMRCLGLRIWYIPVTQQHLDADAGLFGKSLRRPSGRASISVTRTMLQAYVHALMQRRPGCIGWISDDDILLDDWAKERGAVKLVNGLLDLRQIDVDVVLGTYAGAAPLPLLTTLELELHDLYANLPVLLSYDPGSPLPDRYTENQKLFKLLPDAYHGFSTQHSKHLQSSIWLSPSVENESVEVAFNRLAEELSGLTRGMPVFRVLPENNEIVFVQSAHPSINRGGITWILNADVLTDAPNMTAEIDGDSFRRSDMLWCLFLRKRFERKIVQVPSSFLQNRSENVISDPWQDQVRDIRGHALTHALQIISENNDLFSDLDEEIIGETIKLFLTRLKERTGMLVRSIARIRTLIFAIRSMKKIEYPLRHKNWNAKNIDLIFSRIESVLSKIERLVGSEEADKAITILLNTSTETVVDYLQSFSEKFDEWGQTLRCELPIIINAQSTSNHSRIKTVLQDRVANAEAGIRNGFHLIEDLNFLGAGREGVVFHNGEHVFKWFDSLPLRIRTDHMAFLNSLVGQLNEVRSLPRLRSVINSDSNTLVCYDYIPSEPYRGGHGPGIVRLLQECKKHHVACTNLHPDNLRICDEDVLLIDVGADIVPLTKENWDHMINRAFLSWRWWFRDDLKSLMTKALTMKDIPELEGVDRLRELLNARDATEELNNELLDRILTDSPKSVLDYGCGKGKLAQNLASLGIDVLGWDPDESLKNRWELKNNQHFNLTYGNRNLLNQLIEHTERFDVVVCTLVLCILEGEEYETAIENLFKLVKSTGRVIVTVCNPYQTFGGSTLFKSRPKIYDRDFDETFRWTGNSGYTGDEKIDIHRPLRVLERDLARHGLLVIDRVQSSTVDLERFESASDFITLELKPDKSILLDATLAVKTCAMDHSHLEESVRHLITTMEGPEVFSERLLVVDSRLDGFSRKYDDGDFDALCESANRLVKNGYIDRVIYTSVDVHKIRKLNKRWFGIDSESTHAVNGSPISSALTMFEEVQTPCVLQIDSDMMLHRVEPRKPVIGEWINILYKDSMATTLAIPIANNKNWGPQSKDENGTFRMEVRAALIHLKRFRALCPFPNSVKGKFFELAWYRSFDQHISNGSARSLRIGDHRLWAVHPPNHRKKPFDEWLMAKEICQRGPIPNEQVGNSEWVGKIADWLGPKRDEPFIFVLQGRNISPGRMQRAIDSINKQSMHDWGAILLDDGSDGLRKEWILQIRQRLGNRWTVLHSPVRRYGMANLVWAVRYLCVNPESVIITVDLDDALIGTHVLDILVENYQKGADLTVGSLLRTDKQKIYEVNFYDPRNNYGGNIWLHLRSFHKALFDAVPDEYFHDRNGDYFQVAQDWAFMLPMVEIARNPRFISNLLYLYEPFGDGKSEKDNQERLQVINEIFAKPSLVKLPV